MININLNAMANVILVQVELTFMQIIVIYAKILSLKDIFYITLSYTEVIQILIIVLLV